MKASGWKLDLYYYSYTLLLFFRCDQSSVMFGLILYFYLTFSSLSHSLSLCLFLSLSLSSVSPAYIGC